MARPYRSSKNKSRDRSSQLHLSSVLVAVAFAVTFILILNFRTLPYDSAAEHGNKVDGPGFSSMTTANLETKMESLERNAKKITQENESLKSQIKRLLSSSAVSTSVSDQTDSSRTVAAAKDPEGIDCTELMQDFRNDNIELTKTKTVESQNAEGATGETKEFNYKRLFGTVARGVANPFYISTHDKTIDYVREIIFRNQLYYETFLTKRVEEIFTEKSKMNQPSFFLDVGANIGWFSLVAKASGADKVFSFEPNVQNIVRICESISLNHWSHGSVVPIQKGLGSKEQQLPFYASYDKESNPGGFSFRRKFDNDRIIGTFNITTLDLFAERHGWFDINSKVSVGLLKVDVENFEYDVLMGGKRLLQSGIVDNIVMELKKEKINVRKKERKELLELILASGYEPYMNGRFKGPNNLVTKRYKKNSEELFNDIHINAMYGENFLFRRSSIL